MSELREALETLAAKYERAATGYGGTASYRSYADELSSLLAAHPAEPAPLLDREAVWRGIYSAAIQHLNPSGVADKATDAVLALLTEPPR